jgi:hypothetical protein
MTSPTLVPPLWSVLLLVGSSGAACSAHPLHPIEDTDAGVDAGLARISWGSDGEPLAYSRLAAAADGTLFLAGWRQLGTLQSSLVRYGPLGESTALAVPDPAVRFLGLDATLPGRLVLLGTTLSEARFPGDAGLALPAPPPNAWSNFLALVDAQTGRTLWVRPLGVQLGTNAVLAVNPSDNAIVVAGQFSGTGELGGGALTAIAPSDLFLARYAPEDGHHLSSQRLGGAGTESVTGIALDAQGRVALGGTYGGAGPDFGNGPLQDAPGGGLNGFVLVLDSTLAFSWARSFANSSSVSVGSSTASRSSGGALTFDDSGNLIVVGWTLAGFSAGGKTLVFTGGTSAQGWGAKFNRTGAHLWSRMLNDGRGPAQLTIAASAGQLIAAGQFDGTLHFGGQTWVTEGGDDCFVSVLDPEGTPVRSTVLGGVGPNNLMAWVLVPGAEEVFATGSFLTPLLFGDSRLAPSGSGPRQFLARLRY